MPLHTDLNTDKGKQNKKKTPPFIIVLSLAQRWMVFVELGIKALLFARVDVRKIASLVAVTNICQAIRERHSTPRLGETMQLLCVSIVLTDPLFDVHEARVLFLMTQPRAKGQCLASPREPNRLNMNTRIVPSSSCVEGKPDVKPCSYRPSPNYVLSRPRASLTPHSTVPPPNSILTH